MALYNSLRRDLMVPPELVRPNETMNPGEFIAGGRGGVMFGRPGLTVTNTMPRVAPQPGQAPLPRLGLTSLPAAPSSAIRDRAALGVAAMRRRGPANRNIEAIRDERAAAAQPAPLTEKERVAKIQAEGGVAEQRVINEREKMKQEALTMREGTFAQKQAKERKLLEMEQAYGVNMETLKSVNEQVISQMKGDMPGTAEWNIERKAHLEDAAAQAEATGDLERLKSANALLAEYYKAQVARSSVEEKEQPFADAEGNVQTMTTRTRNVGRVPPPPGREVAGDTDNNGVPDADVEANAAINFMRRYDAIPDADPRRNQHAADYERAKLIVGEWRRKQKEAMGG